VATVGPSQPCAKPYGRRARPFNPRVVGSSPTGPTVVHQRIGGRLLTYCLQPLSRSRGPTLTQSRFRYRTGQPTAAEKDRAAKSRSGRIVSDEQHRGLHSS
jgi:hypothetical protein